ncbi:hypothetical protein [Rhizobium sp. 2MFCol3.1]|uniref:hypothetical protein n=1 Tax=Rhizobium sp. 2MFCol3.1 TaxID=1246459 RepID=UPI0012DD8623|nr:hypothetical protein [Rhizobium sp. 2MFCol3.1]
MLHLLIRQGQDENDAFTPFDDSREPYETIGFNNLANTQEDRWDFAGWDWQQDCFVTGAGEVIGWLPFGQPPSPIENVRGDLYDADAFMADGGYTPMTSAEAVLAWLLIEKIGVPDDVCYSPNQAQDIIVRRLDLARELEEIDAMLAEGQGDDQGHPIMPEFTKSMTTYAKVEACLHLLERRRDALHPSPVSNVVGADRLIEAAKDVIVSASDTYKKRNGHLGSFEDDSGEKCWIVPFDAFEGLRSAVDALASTKVGR